jgi:predicted dehydrogenase
MHTLLFLDPGHFHAALTLRVPHPRVADEVFVYAPEGSSAGRPEERELPDFLALIERFNRRAEQPTHWRPVVRTCADPFARLVDERRGDVAVLAGRNGGKARTIRRLHEAGFHVLADKPWLVDPEDIDHVRPSLADWPLVMEIMTGRHDVAARLFKRLVDTPDVFGVFRGEPAIELESVHHLEKLVDGAPLRRPWWFFDVRIQGSGAVDIPTHLVDQTQWLVDGTGVTPAEHAQLLSARAWSTRVPGSAFHRITGHTDFPPELRPFMDGDALSYLCNAEINYRVGRVTARAAARWDLSAPPGGGDASRVVAHGTRADIVREQGPHTGNRRRLFVEITNGSDRVAHALADTVASWKTDLTGVGVEAAGSARYEVTIPAALDGGHETHFARVLDDFLQTIDEHRWPAALVERTLAKYTLLAEAAARTSADHAMLMVREENR